MENEFAKETNIKVVEAPNLTDPAVKEIAFTLGRLRIKNITKIAMKEDVVGYEHRPVKEGLAIEWNCSDKKDKPSYIVLMFVYFDDKEDEFKYEFVADRFKYLTSENIEQFKDVTNIAELIIKEEYKEEDYE